MKGLEVFYTEESTPKLREDYDQMTDEELLDMVNRTIFIKEKVKRLKVGSKTWRTRVVTLLTINNTETRRYLISAPCGEIHRRYPSVVATH